MDILWDTMGYYGHTIGGLTVAVGARWSYWTYYRHTMDILWDTMGYYGHTIGGLTVAVGARWSYDTGYRIQDTVGSGVPLWSRCPAVE